MYELTQITYKPGWHFYTELIRNKPHLTISTTTTNSYNPADDQYHTAHYFEMPDVCHDIELWLFECILLVEKHEAMEFYQVHGKRVYAPVHSRAANSYYDLPHGIKRTEADSH